MIPAGAIFDNSVTHQKESARRPCGWLSGTKAGFLLVFADDWTVNQGSIVILFFVIIVILIVAIFIVIVVIVVMIVIVPIIVIVIVIVVTFIKVGCFTIDIQDLTVGCEDFDFISRVATDKIQFIDDRVIIINLIPFVNCITDNCPGEFNGFFERNQAFHRNWGGGAWLGGRGNDVDTRSAA